MSDNSPFIPLTNKRNRVVIGRIVSMLHRFKDNCSRRGETFFVLLLATLGGLLFSHLLTAIHVVKYEKFRSPEQCCQKLADKVKNWYFWGFLRLFSPSCWQLCMDFHQKLIFPSTHSSPRGEMRKKFIPQSVLPKAC